MSAHPIFHHRIFLTTTFKLLVGRDYHVKNVFHGNRYPAKKICSVTRLSRDKKSQGEKPFTMRKVAIDSVEKCFTLWRCRMNCDIQNTFGSSQAELLHENIGRKGLNSRLATKMDCL